MSESLKSLQREQLRLVGDDPGFALILARILETIEQLRSELEQDISPEETTKIRGKIAGLRLALEIRGILMAELSF